MVLAPLPGTSAYRKDRLSLLQRHATSQLSSLPRYSSAYKCQAIISIYLSPKDAAYFDMVEQKFRDKARGEDSGGHFYAGNLGRIDSRGWVEVARDRFARGEAGKPFPFELVPGRSKLKHERYRREWDMVQRLLWVSVRIYGVPLRWLERLAQANSDALYERHKKLRRKHRKPDLQPPGPMPLMAQLMYEPAIEVFRSWEAFLNAFEEHFSGQWTEWKEEVTPYERRRASTTTTTSPFARTLTPSRDASAQETPVRVQLREMMEAIESMGAPRADESARVERERAEEQWTVLGELVFEWDRKDEEWALGTDRV